MYRTYPAPIPLSSWDLGFHRSVPLRKQQLQKVKSMASDPHFVPQPLQTLSHQTPGISQASVMNPKALNALLFRITVHGNNLLKNPDCHQSSVSVKLVLNSRSPPWGVQLDIGDPIRCLRVRVLGQVSIIQCHCCLLDMTFLILIFVEGTAVRMTSPVWTPK